MQKTKKGITDLTRAERLEIDILLGKGYSLRSVARALGRGKSTLAYEVTHNSTNGVYDGVKAHGKTRLRKRLRRLSFAKIEEYPELKRFVIGKLAAHWNPDEIAGYLKRHHRRYPWYVSKTAIYEWLRTARGERYCALLYSKRKRVKRRKKKTARVIIPNRVPIERRPRGAENRTQHGHLEVDTMVGRRGTPGGLKTGYDRKNRLVLAHKVKNMKPSHHTRVERRILAGVSARSITRDNGIENREHERISVPSFFCRPYASWQKGGVEHANRMLRRYFPKGTDFRTVTEQAVDRAVLRINEKPRRVLGYRSALEVARAGGMIM